MKIPLKSRTRLKTKFSTSVKAIFRKYFEVTELNITLLPSSQIFKLVRTTQTKVWTMILSTLSSYFLHFIPPWLENLFINNNSKKTILTKSYKTWTVLLILVNWLNPKDLCFKLNAPFLIDNTVNFASSLRSKD